VWEMLARPLAVLEARAQAWAQQLGTGAVVAGESTVGGGSLPGETLPTRLLALSVKKPNQLAARLRAQSPAIVARVSESQLLLDPRTVDPDDEPALLRGLRGALGEQS
jgi:L-seryl-tRNA(Ser) seleniumtransferase